MSVVLIEVHVPVVYRRRRALDASDVESMDTSESGGLTTSASSEDLQGKLLVEEVQVASLMRDFLINSKAQLDFVAEQQYLIGNTRWAKLSFTCKAAFAEECLNRMSNLGIGVLEGIGIVNVMPLAMQRVASHPVPRAPALAPKPADVAAALAAPVGKDTGSLSPEEHQTKSNDLAAAAKAIAQAVHGDRTLEEVMENKMQKHEQEEQQELQRLQALAEEDEGGEEALDDDSVHDEHSHRAKVVEVTKERSTRTGFASTFAQTIKSRIAVDAVIELVNASAKFSFDYVMLVIVASILACIGLAVSNVVIIVASMLVSPLMGPILAVTFGWTMRDRKMILEGLFSELMGLLLCAIVGFVGGLCAAPFIGTSWPTAEMWSRATPDAVFVGISIAIPSGVGVALSVLGDNTSSLVGVAISASLLPPAVNTGQLLAMAALARTPYIDLVAAQATLELDYDLTVGRIVEGSMWSLLLTIANILCIWVAGILMFKLKEVAPLRAKSDFWTTHVPNARVYNTHAYARGDPEGEKLREAVRNALVNSHKSQFSLPQGLDNLQATTPTRHHPVLDPSFFSPPPYSSQGSHSDDETQHGHHGHHHDEFSEQDTHYETHSSANSSFGGYLRKARRSASSLPPSRASSSVPYVRSQSQYSHS